ncbi:MAG: hypothetical protein L0Y67_09345 [Gammaproteobacteria bacterium]|nr:hypothetical protein [Gammaproteobacteria bacterium]
MPEIPAFAIVGYVYLGLLAFYLVEDRWLGNQRIEEGVVFGALPRAGEALRARRHARRSRALGFQFAM